MAADSIIPDVALGENSRIFLGTKRQHNMTVLRGSVSETPNEQSTSANRTGGYTTRTRTLFDFTLSASAQWQTKDNPISLPPKIRRGGTLFEVEVVPDIVNAPLDSYFLPIAFVGTVRMTIEGPGIITYDLEIKNQGVYSTLGDPKPVPGV